MLRRVILHVRSIERSKAFWGPGGVGLPVRAESDSWAMLAAGPHVDVHLRATEKECELGAAYTPFLQLDVRDLPSLVPTLLHLGGTLDGGIEYTPTHTVASMRAPDGHMVTLVEQVEQPGGAAAGSGGPAPLR